MRACAPSTALAVSITRSGVNPNSRLGTGAGADAPNLIDADARAVAAAATAQGPYEALDVVTMPLPPCAQDWSLTSRLWIYS